MQTCESDVASAFKLHCKFEPPCSGIDAKVALESMPCYRHLFVCKPIYYILRNALIYLFEI